jgi:hypothetical protein
MELEACKIVETNPPEPGRQMFVIRTNSHRDKEAVEIAGPIYFKIVPGLQTPGNLPIECFPEYEKL